MSLESHIPVTHLFITSEDPPKLKLDVVVYIDAGKKITLQDDPPKTYGDQTIINYKVVDDISGPVGYFHRQFEFFKSGKPHIVETAIMDGAARHFVINSSDRAEPI